MPLARALPVTCACGGWSEAPRMAARAGGSGLEFPNQWICIWNSLRKWLPFGSLLAPSPPPPQARGRGGVAWGVVGRSFLRLAKIPMDTLVLGANYIGYLEAKIGQFRARISIGIFG